MAVAVKAGSETTGQHLFHHLGLSCFLGACYVLFAAGMLFSGIPWMWNHLLELNELNVFLSDALLLLVLGGAAVGFVVLGKALEGLHPPRGLRAGTFLTAVALFVMGLITIGIGDSLGTQDAWIKVAIPALVAGGFIVGLAWLLVNPAFHRRLVRLEEHGWFHATLFKPNQGLRVRRGTLMAAIILGVCGIIVLLSHRALPDRPWAIDLPWGNDLELPILANVLVSMLVILVIALLWVSWRIVNWPVFADFLIATEAEMNKVSWTTRRRLFQDTIVVLVTVFLLTIYLFVMDWVWVTILSWRPIGVLPSDFAEQRKQLTEQQQW